MARILITSALPYINGVKHLGNLVGSQLPADVYARYLRARGHEVLLICATDEHGTPAELAAAAGRRAGRRLLRPALADPEGRSPTASACPSTTSAAPRARRTTRLTQHFAGRLADAGLIPRWREQQVYSPADGRFLPDRYIEGTCPQLRLPARPRRPVRELHQAARPDRPDRPALGDLRLAPTSRSARPSTSTCCQSLMRDELRAWIDDQDRLAAARPPRSPCKWLDERACRTAAITRDLDWGIPVRRGDRALARHGGQGLLRLVRRPDRVHRRHRGMGRRQRPAARRLASAGGARTRARTTSATSSSWARTTSRSTRCRFPATILGLAASRGSSSTTSSPSTG